MIHWPDLVQNRLSWGRDRAVTLSELAERMGTSRRTIEKAIETLRVTGAPVCTSSEDPKGAWLTTDPNELREQYRALRRRYLRQAVNARVLLATAKRFEKVQQMEMFG